MCTLRLSDPRDARPKAKLDRRRRRPRWVASILALLCLGCGINTREARLRNSVRDHWDAAGAKLMLTSASRDLLARERLIGAPAEEAALRLEGGAASGPQGDPAAPLALAELWYRVGLEECREERAESAVAFRNAASAAAIGLSDPRLPCVDRAVEIHDGAVARLVRYARKESERGGANWRVVLSGLGVETTAADAFVDPTRFVAIEIADDFRVRGVRRRFGADGLGVAVVGTIEQDPERLGPPGESFFPPKLMVGATIVATPSGGLSGGGWRAGPLLLRFNDPFKTRSIAMGERNYRMAFDTTTALAVQVSQPILSADTMAGLLLSDFQRGIKPGLYMLRPWQPGKIPVVFVHGLNSNPSAFAQAINELRNDPTVESRYQFMMFAYPTGRPITTSALRLRESLHAAESKFGSDPAFHEMVLVGHSMGGNLTRIMISESGRILWDSVLNVPPERLQGPPELKARLEEMLIFHPVPFVKRAVFIAAPHRGSRISEELLGRVIGRLIRQPEEQRTLVEAMTAANGPDVFKSEVFRNRSINSIGNLSTRSPVLLSVDQMPIAPGVRTHSIQFDFLGVFPTDLVVRRGSSDFPEAESRLVAPGTHFSEQGEAAVEELRRILTN